MEPNIVQQGAQKIPARAGKEIAITLDATSRSYDLWSIALGTPAINTNVVPGTPESFNNVWFEIEFVAETVSAWFLFGSTAPTVDQTATVAAGGAIAYTANASDIFVVGVPRRITINRGTDRFLALKASGAGTLRFHIVSYRNDTAKSV